MCVRACVCIYIYIYIVFNIYIFHLMNVYVTALVHFSLLLLKNYYCRGCWPTPVIQLLGGLFEWTVSECGLWFMLRGTDRVAVLLLTSI